MDLWLLLIVMSLATYRVTRLVVADTFPPVLWLRDRLVGGWREPTMKEQHHELFPTGEVEEHTLKSVPGLGMFQLVDDELFIYARRWKRSPFWLAELLSCPWCASGWIALAVTAGVWAVAGLAMPALVWLAVWAAGALLAGQEWA
ncbi:DUF1360 domain-containing protein [Streptomyces caniscabiei]|uniref:DUF1360 domain-containing protein n=1 Tax=Streptomyces caniscabiei TaxID=2746961 RepID=A0ABU4MQN5_9ACTN|nr:DUF1360 domain-containing protein [Streptomyces caniscabiei]MBE4735700.1 DUF1360 domain-containing protein [Streptomyces caniscabiei]MBE4758313.1 DUF1360 domain-containing protein [Streptomyces caniscabiei]MBE4788406.1 DUF1360 domain-containing protein [Streptomyces caniscabiei]MBE4796119.1 DUF1360 domain-containing protein [Streptomyces caniscabiei]MDX2944424.1 DUF1360 domain-containing protein [Streptomyces caniscabiei]